MAASQCRVSWVSIRARRGQERAPQRREYELRFLQHAVTVSVYISRGKESAPGQRMPKKRVHGMLRGGTIAHRVSACPRP